MSCLNKPAYLAAALCFGLAATSARAGAGGGPDADFTRAALRTQDGQQIPAGAFGIVEIKAPRQATLLQLRGMAGSGEALLRGDEPGRCVSFPLRFVAGDFGGDAIGSHLTDPILVVLKSRRVAETLADGRDVVSDMYRISRQDTPDADIVIKSGLSGDYGFVLNPGSTIMADIWGVGTRSIPCSPI